MVLMIEVAACPLMYVWMVFYLNMLVIVRRNTKGIIKTVLLTIVSLMFAPVFLIPLFVSLFVIGGPLLRENSKWAFIISVTILHILSFAPSFWYKHKKERLVDSEKLGFWHK